MQIWEYFPLLQNNSRKISIILWCGASGEYVCLRIRHIERADEWHHVVWDGPVGFVVVLGDIGPDMDGLFLQVYVFTFQKGYFASLPRF